MDIRKEERGNCMDLKNIGANVKKLRLEKKMTQAKLAELANISTVHMSHIETGSVSMSLESLLELSRALNTTPNRILLGEYELSHAEGTQMAQTQELTSDENLLLVEFAELLKKRKINRN